MAERIVYAPRGRHSHALDDETGRTRCGINGDSWYFDGPRDGERPSCGRCAAPTSTNTETTDG